MIIFLIYFGDSMNKWGELLITIILLFLGGLSIVFWWKELVNFIKGGIGIILILFGLLFLLITIEDFKE